MNVAPLEVQPIRVTMDVNVNVHESDTPVGNAGEEDDASGAGTRDAEATDAERD